MPFYFLYKFFLFVVSLLLSFPLESKPLDIQEVTVLFIAVSPVPRATPAHNRNQRNIVE